MDHAWSTIEMRGSVMSNGDICWLLDGLTTSDKPADARLMDADSASMR